MMTPLRQYLLAAAITVLVDWAKIKAWSINLVIGLFLSEVTTLIGRTLPAHSSPETVKPGTGEEILVQQKAVLKRQKENLRAHKENLRTLFGAQRVIGRVVGIVEGLLYLYGLFSGVQSIISGVLLFKAFFTWLEPKKPGSADMEAIKTDDPEHDGRMLTLGRYSVYLIGNFMSLLWSVAIFEAVHATALASFGAFLR